MTDTEASLSAPKNPPFNLTVLGTGLLSTALVLLTLYLLKRWDADIDPMGWYVMPFIPVGAILVGVGAGCGYGIGAYFSGIKVKWRMLTVVLILQTAAYFASHYIEYHDFAQTHPAWAARGFVAYFDAMTRSLEFHIGHNRPGAPTSPSDILKLGVWNYLLRGAELLGFLVGGVFIPLVLSKKPYCETCQVYQRQKEFLVLTLGIQPEVTKKKSTPPLPPPPESLPLNTAAPTQPPTDTGLEITHRLLELAAAGDVTNFQTLVAEHKPRTKKAKKATERQGLQLRYCPICKAGELVVLRYTGQGQALKTATVETLPVDANWVVGMVG